MAISETDRLLLEIRDSVSDIKTTLGIQQNEMKHVSRIIDSHEKIINTLEAAHNQAVGKHTIISAFFGFVAGAVGVMVDHLFGK